MREKTESLNAGPKAPSTTPLYLLIAVAVILICFVGALYLRGSAAISAARSQRADLAEQGALELGWRALCSKITGVASYRVVEAGGPLPEPRSFLEKGQTDPEAGAIAYGDTAAVDLCRPGAYPITLMKGDKAYRSEIIVVDTTPPTAEPADQQCLTVDTLPAESFAANIQDATPVSASYLSQPDFASPGVQNVEIRLTDSGGNEITLSAVLTVVEDTTPPVITGARDQRFHVGDTVAYKKDVTVTDDYDQEVILMVDSSAVNPTQPGQYQVVYSARDRSGNLTALNATFTFTEATEFTERMEEEAEKVLAKITTEGMSQTEIARAIYQWTKSHIGYTAHSDKEDWEKAAVQGFIQGSGDCYVYFATSKALLEQAGIENIDVEKIEKPGRSRHYWSLINCGGGWYHFDTTPRKGGGEFFLLTDAELEAYSSRHDNSHEFDHTLYPATPEE